MQSFRVEEARVIYKVTEEERKVDQCEFMASLIILSSRLSHQNKKQQQQIPIL